MRTIRISVLLLAASLLQACAVARLDDSLPRGIMNNDDLQLVEQGLPAYLLMLDGFIVNWPESEGLLRSGANLYSAYAGLFVEDNERAQKLTEQALEYSMRAACAEHDELCDLRSMAVPELEKVLADMDAGDVPIIYNLGTTWAGYIQVRSSDWNAIGSLGRVNVLLERSVALDEDYKKGQGHMYLGVMNSFLPKSMGGRPAKAKGHFEKAIALSEGDNLLAKVLYAEHYARLAFDRELHDRLLEEALEADPHRDGLTLQNVYAQKEARTLLKGSGDYFE
jgi:tetratricopeptide (TPR) repeat protein